MCSCIILTRTFIWFYSMEPRFRSLIMEGIYSCNKLTQDIKQVTFSDFRSLLHNHGIKLKLHSINTKDFFACMQNNQFYIGMVYGFDFKMCFLKLQLIQFYRTEFLSNINLPLLIQLQSKTNTVKKLKYGIYNNAYSVVNMQLSFKCCSFNDKCNVNPEHDGSGELRQTELVAAM